MSTAYLPRTGSGQVQYRPNYTAPAVPRGPNVTDDYERWYTEGVPNNRMVLSLKSGIDQEVGWALDRLCRLCHNDQFSLKSIPALTDALFEWPEWYATEGYQRFITMRSLFSTPRELERKRRHALESLFVLRNAALTEYNSHDLLIHSHTMPFILNTLHNLDSETDENSEFVLHTIDLLHSISSKVVLPPPSADPRTSPFQPLQNISWRSSNRPTIISALSTLTSLISVPQNVLYITSTSLSLETSLRYLPLFEDKPLVEACLNFLYVHLSHPPMAKAFLLHSSMSSVIKLLVSHIIKEQMEETVVLDVSGVIQTLPAEPPVTRDHELTQAELDELLRKLEPERCYDWMKIMFEARPDGEVTQVDFWNLYKDTFLPHKDEHFMLSASDVIKQVNGVFPQAQAMVLGTGPQQKFIVRGVDRRKESVQKFKCLWDRSQCPIPVFTSYGDLYEHVLEHLVSAEGQEISCLWSTCQRQALPKPALRAHILTHLSADGSANKPPSQSDTITLSSQTMQHPAGNPTTRPPPPPRSTTISYKAPIVDPPSSALTALLCIRILFRTAFASSEAAPRADSDHFGFPGITEDIGDLDGLYREAGESDKEGERCGRLAFIGVRHLLQGVRIKDEILMDWIREMVEAGLTGSI